MGPSRELPSDETLETYRWLVEGAGREILAALAGDNTATHELIRRLRKTCTAAQTHLLLEQRDLRARGSLKFPRAASMFFTRRSLEQASDFRIANYKARRFPVQSLVIDACCGLGGDLLSLGTRGPVLGIDRDPLLCYLATANLAVAGAHEGHVWCEDLATSDLPRDATMHVDPDRRPQERRTVQLAAHEPNDALLSQWIASQPGVALKLSPAASPEEALLRDADLEWIGHSGQCQQLVAWFGTLARQQGMRTATLLRDEASDSWTGDSQCPLVPTDVPEPFLYEPHPTVLAAGLAGAWAASHDLRSLTPGGGYLTGGRVDAGPWAQTLEVLDWMPFRQEKIRSWLRERRVGPVEVKKRNVELDPAKLQREWTAQGDERAVVVVTRLGARVIALLCRRDESAREK